MKQITTIVIDLKVERIGDDPIGPKVVEALREFAQWIEDNPVTGTSANGGFDAENGIHINWDTVRSRED